MKFGIFYEHQLPRPWSDGIEQKLFQDARLSLPASGGFDRRERPTRGSVEIDTV